MNRELFVAILSMDSYNRDYGRALNFTRRASAAPRDDTNQALANATLIMQFDVQDGLMGVLRDCASYGMWVGDSFLRTVSSIEA